MERRSAHDDPCSSGCVNGGDNDNGTGGRHGVQGDACVQYGRNLLTPYRTCHPSFLDSLVSWTSSWTTLGPPLLVIIAVPAAWQISPSSKAEPSFSALMDASEAYASFQRFVRQGEQNQYRVSHWVNDSIQ